METPLDSDIERATTGLALGKIAAQRARNCCEVHTRLAEQNAAIIKEEQAKLQPELTLRQEVVMKLVANYMTTNASLKLATSIAEDAKADADRLEAAVNEIMNRPGLMKVVGP